MKCLLTILLFSLALSNIAFSQGTINHIIDSLSLELQQADKDTNKVNILNEICEVYWKRGKLDTALSYGISAIKIAQDLNFKEGILDAFNNLGITNAIRGDYQASLSYFKKALEVNRQEKDLPNTASSLNNIGNVYLKLADYPNALEYYQKALEINKEIEDKSKVANNLGNLGIVYYYLSNYPKALESYHEALKINRETRDTSGISTNLANLGNLYHELSNYPKALEYYEKALKMHIQIGKKTGEVISLSNIGSLYFNNLHDKSMAMTYFQKSLNIAREIGFRSMIATNFYHLGDLYGELTRYSESLDYFRKALRIDKEIGRKSRIVLDRRGIVEWFINVPDSTLKLVHVKPEDRYATALQYADSTMLLAKEIGSIDLEEELWKQLSVLYAQQNKYKNAHEAYKNYILLRDSMLNLETRKQITRMEVEFEYEKKMAASKTEHEKDLLRMRTYLIIGAFLIILLAMLFFGQKYRSRKNRQLWEKSKEVELTKANFFANISHEFRTPLTLILGPLESLLQQDDDPGRKGMYSLMKRNSRRLLQQINEILDLSQIEDKQIHLHPQEIDMNSFVRRVLAEFNPLAVENQTTLTFESNVDKLQAMWDIGRLETILYNLISNSLKHTHNGNVTVGIRGPGGSDRYQIFIKDTGTGIPREKLDKIFNRFYHEDDHLGDSPSTGIGLELTRYLIELHGGSIKAQSEMGHGSIFTMTMPVIPPFEEETGSPVAQESNNQTKHEPVLDRIINGENEIKQEEKPLLLIVEDHKDMREYLRNILQDNYRIIEASDGTRGVDIALEEIPDLVISDVMMPGKDGYELCAELKQDIKTSHIPIILLTAKSSPKDRITGLEQKADYYMGKPFIPKELLVSIDNLIEGRKKLRKRYERVQYLHPFELQIKSTDEQFIARLMGVLENHYSDPTLTVELLSKEIGMSRSQLYRKLHALTDESISKFIRNYRLQCAMEMLEKESGNISEICYEVGFNNLSYFNKCFLEYYGRTPTQVKNAS